PLGDDVLLLRGLAGREGLSQLFEFTLEVLADNHRQVPFEKLLGQPLAVRLELPGKKQRYLSGICNRVSQGARDQHFTAYTLTMVPTFWLWTKKQQCRIFQQLTVPEILRGVLSGLDVGFELQGPFYPRDYCVQYQETDFNFVSRLMEEEGIYYFFRHTSAGPKLNDKAHMLILAYTPGSHPDCAPAQAIYDSRPAGARIGERIYEWHKTQALCSGKYTLWDHCFELPGKHLEAEKRIVDKVLVGQV